MSQIVIRSLTDMAEMMAAERLQMVTWGIPADEAIPAHTMHALQHNGSALIGAFDGDRLVGYVLGVLGTVSTPDRIDQIAAARLKMFSVIAGVLPEYQSQGVGYRLKQAQRDFALAIGIRLITWTYDPLESANGRFNMSKLGAICHTYLRNFHGEMGGINAGLASDRFEVEWWVTSNRVRSRAGRPRRPLTLDALQSGGAILLNPAVLDHGLPAPAREFDIQPAASLLLVEIPNDFQRIKQESVALAREWRNHSRQVFEALFLQGYIVTDFVVHRDDNATTRSFYLLTYKDA